jgi:hypothetical protein
MIELYKDESDLNMKLTDLLNEDASISKQLSLIVRAIQTVTDVNIEYSVIESIMELIPVLLAECRSYVHSLFSNVLPDDVFMYMWKSGRVNIGTAKHVRSEVWVQHSEMWVVYYVPDYAEFSLFHLTFLPLKVNESSACLTIQHQPYMGAVGMDGVFFEYDGESCISESDSAYCDTDRVTIRNHPSSCVEKLLVGDYKQLPKECRDTLKIGVCSSQEFFRNMGKTYIFSPYAETVISDCKGIQRVHQIVAGTTVFDSTACTLRTTELLILGMRQITGMQDIDAVSNFDITLSKMSSVLEDITISDTMLLGNQTKLLVEYLAAAKTENIDLKKATDELKKFKAVSFLSNYTLFDFDLDVPLGMSNAVTGAYVGLAFPFFLFSLLCCCSCKCIRTAMFGLAK